MKTLIVTSICILSFLMSFGQTNFEWDKIDSIPKTQNEIYALTKMFITDTWKNPQHVIQMDDKEDGAIVVNGISVQTLSYTTFGSRNVNSWTFSYTIKFLFKDNKYRTIITNVSCQSTKQTPRSAITFPCLNMSYVYPPQKNKGLKETWVTKERHAEIMDGLKSDLQGLADRYEKYLIENSNGTITNSNSNW